MSLLYDVYIATDSHGPWTKATSSPIVNDPLGNQFTITGLTNGQLYYIMVIAGKYNSDGEFMGICGQPIVQTSSPGSNGPSNPNIIAAKPLIIPRGISSVLGFSLTIDNPGGP